MDELKPCPFCGEDVSIQEVIGEISSEEDWITCDRCAKCFVFASKDGIRTWNTRPIEDALRAKLDKAREVLRYIGYSKGVSTVDFSWKNEWQILREHAKKALAELERP